MPLNNSLIYGYSKNTYRNFIIKSLESAGFKCSIPAEKTDTFNRPIMIKAKHPSIKCTDKISVICYLESETMGISLSNMKGTHDICFISDGKVYIIDIVNIQKNWGDCIARVSKYKDGADITSTMSHMDPIKVKNLAKSVIKIPADINDEIIKSKTKLENDIKKYNEKIKK